MVNHPISVKKPSRVSTKLVKFLPSMFVGCALYAGGIQKGDIKVADIEELENSDASQNPRS